MLKMKLLLVLLALKPIYSAENPVSTQENLIDSQESISQRKSLQACVVEIMNQRERMAINHFFLCNSQYVQFFKGIISFKAKLNMLKASLTDDKKYEECVRTLRSDYTMFGEFEWALNTNENFIKKVIGFIDSGIDERTEEAEKETALRLKKYLKSKATDVYEKLVAFYKPLADLYPILQKLEERPPGDLEALKKLLKGEEFKKLVEDSFSQPDLLYLATSFNYFDGVRI